MSRFVRLLMTVMLVMGLAAPAVLAAESSISATGRVLVSIDGDVTLPTGEQADVVVVTGGDATIRGTVETLVVVGGSAILEGARVESLVIADGTATLDASTVVSGDIRTFEATVTRDPAAVVNGTIRGLESDFLALSVVLMPALLLLAIGFLLATLVAALTLAALAARQVRAAEALIRREPGTVLVVGLASLIVIPILAVVAIITVIGAPLGVSVLFTVWPAAAFVGYLVAAIWVGEWVLARLRDGEPAARPYLAAVVGTIVLAVVGIVPAVGGLVTGIASLFGFGAVVVLAWRVFRGDEASASLSAPHATAPMGA